MPSLYLRYKAKRRINVERIKIGETIKKLRKYKNITQEQLASFIGVSTPAVSKWESGISYPDISVLPLLANYFEVSIDELLNYKNNISEEEIAEIIKKCENLISLKLVSEAIEECEKYIKKYYSNCSLKLQLISVYTVAYINLNDVEEKEKITNRAIEILEEIVNTTTDIEIKELALAQLSSQYMLINNLEKAEESIKKIYKPSLNSNVMLPLIYMQQGKIEEAQKLMQENLNNALNETINSCFSLAVSYYSYKEDLKEEEIDFNKAYKYYELALYIDDKVYKGYMSYSIYFNLANLYMKQNKLEESLECLQNMIKSLKERDKKYIDINELWCLDKIDKLPIVARKDILDEVIRGLNMLKENFKVLSNNKEIEIIMEELLTLNKEKDNNFIEENI